MRKRDLAQNLLATAGQSQQDFSTVGTAARALQESMRFQAIDELDGAVMLDLKAFGKHADRGVA